MAIDLPDDVRGAMGELIAQLKPLCKDVRWTRAEIIHVTLKFIGEVDAAKADSIRAALAPIQSNAPVDMRFRGVGFFPNGRDPHVVWCGIEASKNLAELAAGVETALEPLGIAREQRAFSPHLTLGRLNSARRTRELVQAAKDLEAREFGAMHATQFHLFESFTKPSGAEHRKIQTYSFVKEAAA